MSRKNSDTRTYNNGRIDNFAHMDMGIRKDRTELKKELERRRARDNELVVIKFKNLETPGGVLRFSYKRYAQDPWEKYEFFDGEVYQVKRGVRDHIAKGCYSLVYQPLTGMEGQFAVQAGMHNEYSKKAMTASKKLYRFQALGLDYMDDFDDIAPEITQVSLSVDNKTK
jgi:hypothetical protein